jgi:30S ribosomal protein S31
MGKGDKKTKKGKIWLGTYGNSRKRNTLKRNRPVVTASKPVAVEVEAAPKPRAKAKKAPRKKAAE